MSKINPVVTSAFNIAYTQDEIKKLEQRLEGLLEEVRVIQGPEGPQGRDGLRGVKGDKGIKGDRGPIGEKGDRGESGEQGPQGISGPQGDQGNEGDRGPIGEKGERGEQGVQGVRGETGRDGKVGPQGIQGVKGDKGDQGPQGIQGDQGPQGIQGEVGPQGEKGDRGVDGEKGKTGERGATGPSGPQGIQGERGETGPQGTAGKDAENYEPRFQGLLDEFNEKVKDLSGKVNTNIESQTKRISQQLSTLGGGGSYKLVDNADVDKSAISGVVDNAILIYDPTTQKFKAESFIDVLDRLKAELEVQYNRLIDVVGSYTYVGEALPGTGESEAKWRIKRIEEVGDDFNILWADGDADFNNIWDDRETFTYS